MRLEALESPLDQFMSKNRAISSRVKGEAGREDVGLGIVKRDSQILAIVVDCVKVLATVFACVVGLLSLGAEKRQIWSMTMAMDSREIRSEVSQRFLDRRRVVKSCSIRHDCSRLCVESSAEIVYKSKKSKVIKRRCSSSAQVNIARW